MDGVEPVALAEEVGGRLRGASDAAHLGDALRRDAILPSGLDDDVRDLVVTAAGAQCGLATGVLGLLQIDYIELQHAHAATSRVSSILSA